MHTFCRPPHAAPEGEFKGPSYSHSPVESRGESPPLTSSLHSRNSARSGQEEAYLRKASLLQWIRLSLALLVVATAVATLGVSSHVLYGYNDTRSNNGWQLQYWPVEVDVRPAVATVIAAAVVAAGALIYVAFALVPSPHSRFHVQNFVLAGIAAAGTLASLTVTIFVGYTSQQAVDTGKQTIQSWTCFFRDGARTFTSDANTIGIAVSPDPLLPSTFGRMCTESAAAKWLLVIMVILNVICIGVATVGMLADKRISKVRQSRYQVEKPEYA